VNPDAFAYIFDRLDAPASRTRSRTRSGTRTATSPKWRTTVLPSAHGDQDSRLPPTDHLRRAYPGGDRERSSKRGPRHPRAHRSGLASDCNDALERQTIQRWTEAILLPELVWGTHVGPTTAHDGPHAFTVVPGDYRHVRSLRHRMGCAHPGDSGPVAPARRSPCTRGTAHLDPPGVAVRADLVDPGTPGGSAARDGSEADLLFIHVATSSDETPPGGILLGPESRHQPARGEGCGIPTTSPYAIGPTPAGSPGGIHGDRAGPRRSGLLMLYLLQPEQGVLIHLMESVRVAAPELSGHGRGA
jgi:alpha-galactosidase